MRRWRHRLMPVIFPHLVCRPRFQVSVPFGPPVCQLFQMEPIAGIRMISCKIIECDIGLLPGDFAQHVEQGVAGVLRVIAQSGGINSRSGTRNVVESHFLVFSVWTCFELFEESGSHCSSALGYDRHDVLVIGPSFTHCGGSVPDGSGVAGRSGNDIGRFLQIRPPALSAFIFRSTCSCPSFGRRVTKPVQN